jgi:hypothetical protein
MVYSYKPFQNLASRLIGDKGREVTIVYKTDGVYDPATNTLSRGYEDSVQVVVFFKDAKSNAAQGDIVEAQEKIVMIPALSNTAPRINDIIIDGNQEYTITDVKELKPANETILYEVRVKR